MSFKILGDVSSQELFPEKTAEPVIEEAKPEEVKVEPEPAKVEAKVEPPKEEPKIEEPVKEVPEKTAEPVLDWKEALKKADRIEALKLLGLDDFEIDLHNYRKTTGDLTPYLEAKTKDWDKISDVAILRDDLRRQYPTLSDEDFELLANKRIDQKFILEEGELHDEKDVKLAKIELKTEADAIRQKRKEEQQKFTAPKVEPDDTALKQAEAQKKAYEDYVKSVKTNPVTQKLLSEQKIVMGEGDTYNYKVNAQDLVAVAENPQSFWDMFGEAGKEKWDDFYATVAYAKDRKQVEKSLIEYGKSLALKENAEELENTSKAEPKPAAPQKETLGQAMLKRGTPYSFT